MDIQYIRDNEIHEKYLLNRLDEKEKQAYENFIKSHPQARRELEEMRLLLNGIRSAGKKQMRREIEEQVASMRNPKTDWSVLYKVAAVFFILALLPVIFYYHDQYTDIPEISEQTVPETHQERQESTVSEVLPDLNDNKESLIDAASEKESSQHQKTQRAQKSPLSKSQKFQALSPKRGIPQDLEKRSMQKNEAAGAGVGGVAIETADVASRDVLMDESVKMESDLDQVLGRVAVKGMEKPAKEDLPGEALQEAPSGIIGMDYLPPVRSITFVNNNDSLVLNLNRTNLRQPVPEFLKVNIKEDSLNCWILDLYVSDPLHSLDRKDINVTWEKENQIHVIFTGKATYEIILDRDQKTAQRVE